MFALTAFSSADVFNGNVSEWDVSSVKTMDNSKCRGWWVRIVFVLGGEVRLGLILLQFGCCVVTVVCFGSVLLLARVQRERVEMGRVQCHDHVSQ